MAQAHWKTTNIYKALEVQSDTGSENVKNLLDRPEVMEAIQNILDKGGSTPINFTLHDSAHSFRVAERMWEIIPDETKGHLSAYELGLLLLSAYLHDIGMSPTFDKVNRHKEYLITDKKENLSTEEIEEFQKWIDSSQEVNSIDITKEIVTDTDVSDKILAYYIRHKHNDWSGDWIRKNLKTTQLAGYEAYTDDLILICQSHHEGIEHLKKPVFDPKPITNDSIVHPRYLAMCLRVADVMENDPERTPEVILKHRSIGSDSRKYWKKDHYFNLIRNHNKFTVYARPKRAYLHKAIEETARWIEDELKLCNELTKIKPLQHSLSKSLPYYQWHLEPFIILDLAPKNDAYVYIQGAFRPNTAKMLELLGGHQLYGDAIWAYRELIQNAFDAVKERVAYQIVHEDKDPEKFLRKYGELYSIDIRLEKKEDGYWLVCKDEGVGMTKNIIESYFLESGASKRHEISALERKCHEKGFIFSRTGQFGIGVLSYFMLADKVVVRTKRVQNTGYRDEEAIGWNFEINGTHDFGELRKSHNVNPGTEISFRLRDDIVKDIQKWDEKFCSFLKNDVTVTPCNLNYTSIGKNQQNISYGWTKNKNDIENYIIWSFKKALLDDPSSTEDILSSKEKTARKNLEASANDFAKELKNILNFIVYEGEIPNIGKYRIHIPYFKLKNGYSFVYLKEDNTSQSHHIIKIRYGYWWQTSFEEIYLSLKGFRVNKNGNSRGNLFSLSTATNSISFIELDIEEILESNLSVSRHRLTLDKNFDQAIAFIDSKVNSFIQVHKNLFDNIYGTLNYIYTKVIPNREFWFHTPKDDLPNDHFLVWKPIKYPKYIFSSGNESCIQNTLRLNNIKFGNKKASRLDEITSYESASDSLYYFNKRLTIGWLTYNLKKQFGQSYLLILEGLAVSNRSEFNILFTESPPSWHDILLFQVGDYKIFYRPIFTLNEQFKLSKFYNAEIFEEVYKHELKIRTRDLIDEKWCLAFLIYGLREYQGEKWIALCENYSEVMQHVFDTLSLESTYILDDDDVIEVAFNKWEKLSTEEEKEKIRPTTNIDDFIVSEL